MKIDMSKLSFSTIFRKPSYTALFSILVALVCWFVIVAVTSDERTLEITKVPVSVDTSSGAISSLGLNVIEGEGETVSVMVRGKRIVVGGLKAEDIKLRADLSGITGPASNKELEIKPVLSADDDYEIVSITPSTIKVTFDRLLDKEIPITMDVTGLSVPAEGYMLGDVAVSPSSVTIVGPEIDLNRIAKAVVRADINAPLTQSQIITAGIQFYDSEGSLVEVSSKSHISTSVASVDISIPVKKIVELPLKLSFLNVPEDFPIEELEYTLSNENITVAAPEDAIKNYYEIVVGHIDFTELDLTQNNTVTFDVKLPSGFVNINNIENVVVEFDPQNVIAKNFNLKAKNFSVINVPPAYDVQVLTTAINNVRMVGDKETIEKLLATEIVMEIDLSESEVQPGQYQRSVRIYAPTKGFVWAVGDYSAVISVKEK
ncbi:MAG: CdaR family protein [Angelakisella sp.]|nr:CdaR family protein [Angelakisella sp.]